MEQTSQMNQNGGNLFSLLVILYFELYHGLVLQVHHFTT